jgi:hypothetical protein
MTDLETRLRSTMRAREAEAPSAEEVRTRAFRVSTRRRRPRSATWRAAVAAAVAVPVAAGGLTYAVTRGPGQSETGMYAGPSGPATYAVYLVKGADSLPLLTRVGGVGAAASPGAAGAALWTLFAASSGGGRLNGWAGDRLLGVSSAKDGWHVDVARPPSVPAGASGRLVNAVLEQVSWTLAEATGSDRPVTLSVGGRPLTRLAGQDLYPTGTLDPLILDAAAKTGELYRQRCGSQQYVSVDGVRTPVRTVDTYPLRPDRMTTVTMRAGQTLRWLPEGLCLWQGGLGAARAPYDAFHAQGRGASWTPGRPGQWMVTLGGAADPDYGFVPTGSVGGPSRTRGAVMVRVTS